MVQTGLSLRINSKNENSMVKSFINSFIQEDFFKEMISISLYPADFANTSSLEGNSISLYIKQFLKNLDNISRTIKLPNIQDMKKNIQLIDTILTIRDSNLTNISYNNVFTHLSDLDLSQQRLITESKELVKDSPSFKSLTDKILQSIDTYYSVQEIFDDIISYENVVESLKQGDCPIYEGVENWINNVLNLYNKVTNSNSFKKDKDTDYYVLSDEDSIEHLSNDIADYVFNGYSIYKTGLDIIDHNLMGVESGSVHVISAPSNNGKSLLLSYFTKGIIDKNIDDWEENDGILILTLEDDAKKLTRRLASIYGNVDQDVIRKVYHQGYEISKQLKDQDSAKSMAQNNYKTLFKRILSKSILRTTKKKVKLIVKHCSENVFSATTLTKFLDRLKLDGINIKAVVLDYIDVMATSFKNNNDNTYIQQGQITQELRLVSRNYKIPIITATQSNKTVSDEKVEQNMKDIGDSWKKVTYNKWVINIEIY